MCKLQTNYLILLEVLFLYILLKIIAGPRLSYECINSSYIFRFAKHGGLFLQFSTHKSRINTGLISVITVSEMHIALKSQFQKAVVGIQKSFCGHMSRIKVTSN